MVSTDPISDMLTRIRNAAAINKTQISMPHSKVKETVARILADNGFLKGVNVKGSDYSKTLEITISSEDANSAINEIDRLSKPGRRIYVKSYEIPTVKRGRGIVVVSTSQGVMTGDEAKQKRLGGELICKVY
jgi:small subunit ribosomal protein S8